MREILFKGKRLNNGEWVEGYYVEKTLVHAGNKSKKHFYILNLSGNLEEVDGETVGQYAGLTDKKCVKIFDGDIVRCISELFTNWGKTPTGTYDTSFYEIIICEKSRFHLDTAILVEIIYQV